MEDFTVLPDGVFGLCSHDAEASLTVFSFQVTVWSPQAERSRPLGHSRFVAAMVDGQRLLLTFWLCLCFCIHKSNSIGRCKAIDPVPGHLEMFWWRTPRIPGISRVFQSYIIGDLGSPGSQEEPIMMKPSPEKKQKQRRRNTIKNMFVIKPQRNNYISLCLEHPECTSSLHYEHIINVFYGWSKPERHDTIKTPKLISCFLGQQN